METEINLSMEGNVKYWKYLIIPLNPLGFVLTPKKQIKLFTIAFQL